MAVLNPRRHHLTLRSSRLGACLLLAVLSACGGGDATSGDAVSVQEAEDRPLEHVDPRVFALWTPAEEAQIQAEQRQLDAASDGSQVRLIVRLNPSAVTHADRALAQAARLDAADAQALNSRRLAAKVDAVASASRTVLQRAVLQAAPGAEVRQQFSHAVEGFVITVPWAQASRVAAELARDPSVDDVEVDRLYAVGQSAVSSRALDGSAWGVDRIDQRTRPLDGRFIRERDGSGVSIYVVDTGVSPHSQFGARLVSGFSAVQDGRGTLDCNGHGTHVAGTAAGATMGVAPGARVVPVRVLDCGGSSSGSQLLAGLDWIAAHGTRPGVVNLSLGGAASSTLDAATQRLVGAGFSVVVAAGNSNVDACSQSPARAAGMVTVAASDGNDVKASFSNWGSCVALWAPGTAIGSAAPSSTTAVATMSGTSMASPHAAGAAALLLQAQPAWTPAQVRQDLIARATAQAVTGASAGSPRGLLFAGIDAAGTPQPTPAPAPAPAPALVPVSVQALETATTVPAVGSWTAVATVRVVNAAGQPVAGVQVQGRFSHMSATLSCATSANGQCQLKSAAASWAAQPILGVAIAGLSGATVTDTGAGVRTARVSRPAAPVARVTALTGTMLRATAKATAWTPRFTATVRQESQEAVQGATVVAVLNVHAGSRIVGQQLLNCSTGSNGQCNLTWTGPKLNDSHTGASLQVLAVQRNFLSVDSSSLPGGSVGRVQ